MKKYKSVQKYICFGMITVLMLTGCGSGGNETAAATQNEESEDVEAKYTEDENIEPKISEIDEIECPFPYGKEDWRLVLCAEETVGDRNAYRIRLYDEEDRMLQEVLCDIEAEKLMFRFDRLHQDQTDLSVFPKDAQTTHAAGLLFPWDSEEDRFMEEPIAIPWYEYANYDCTFLVKDKQENTETSTICCINFETGQVLELRRWTLTRDSETAESGKLLIWDCLDEVVLYDGEVAWDGRLINSEYYEELFWEDLNRPWNASADAVIPTAKGGSFETVTYAGREELLADCGFQDAEPFYQYFDRLQNLELELYLDENTGKGCGFQYSYAYNYNMEKIVQCNGFIFEELHEREWADDTLSLLTWDGEDAREQEDVTQVTYGYTEDGKLSSYEVRGITELTRVNWYEGSERSDDTFLSMDWIYHSDGTMYRKYYHHDSLTFGTYMQSQDVYYDELGRPVYRYGYITHGSYEYYYIYDGDRAQPKYGLMLDQNGGYSFPVMVVYQ